MEMCADCAQQEVEAGATSGQRLDPSTHGHRIEVAQAHHVAKGAGETEARGPGLNRIQACVPASLPPLSPVPAAFMASLPLVCPQHLLTAGPDLRTPRVQSSLYPRTSLSRTSRPGNPYVFTL